MRRAARILLAVLLAGGVAAEGAARLAGVGEFPTYLVDSEIGYLLAPNQSGAFLRRNDWVFNELSMGTAQRFQPSEARDVLLIGDSIVFGGNAYRQEEKLGPLLATEMQSAVWPISAGSWALLNELAYLRRNRTVVDGADQLVFVLNSGDFGEASVWAGEATHPTRRPLLIAPYALHRYVLRRLLPADTGDPPLRSDTRDWRKEWQDLVTTTQRPVLLVAFPDRRDAQRRAPPAEAMQAIDTMIASAPPGRVAKLDLTQEPAWVVSLYRDDIHPTPEGNRTLARLIADRLP